jgi:hypothetical protein
MRKNKGQSMLEYFILIGIIMGALFAMQAYMKRGIQGKMRASADQVSYEGTYSPGATNSDITTTKEIKEKSQQYSINNDPYDSADDLDIRHMEATVKKDTKGTEEVLEYYKEPQRVFDEQDASL